MIVLIKQEQKVKKFVEKQKYEKCPFSTASTVGSCESKQDLLPSLRHLPSGRVAGIQMGVSNSYASGSHRSEQERERES